ncbi:phosphate acyltransferase PlsX [Rhodomicrobium lacus]|uniref:phosphate acyltransferase PlsX n=1 Tax=Rhodomicrobium lacus TaxID=2498452 RepID=UPI000F8C41A5|nr:phosphate acyltransferase PlsX [Rhodomicrobium lacus]
MGTPITIALDAMGGDFGPSVVIPAAALSLIRHPETRFIIFGREDEIRAHLSKDSPLAAVSKIVHSDVAIAMDDKPSQALRYGRWKSSMWMALEAVKQGEAQAAVSAGNTGALMAMSKFCLRMLPGIERPAIAALWPTLKSESIVLDVGANVGATAKGLVDNANMGAALARALFQVEKPTIGLLNIGSEEVKGLEEIKRAAAALKTPGLPITYYGFVEGNDLGKGVVDVVVTEGFAGNIALKTAEGTAKQIGAYLKAAMTRSLMSKLGAVFAQGAFKALRAKMDTRTMNGGMFVGLNGVVIKSHGGADAVGFASAIDLGYDMAASGLVADIQRGVESFHDSLQAKPEQALKAVAQ